jgi:hypothetical protein
MAAYRNRLAAADPLRLYIGCLSALRQKYERFPREMQYGFIDFLCTQIRTLHRAGLWPSRAIELDELI